MRFINNSEDIVVEIDEYSHFSLCIFQTILFELLLKLYLTVLREYFSHIIAFAAKETTSYNVFRLSEKNISEADR